jgi:hypothetical protein
MTFREVRAMLGRLYGITMAGAITIIQIRIILRTTLNPARIRRTTSQPSATTGDLIATYWKSRLG